MQPPAGVRVRLALSKRKNLPLVLLGATLALLGVLALLSNTPAERALESLTKDETARAADAELDALFPGKCRIKNFDELKRMSIVYTWVNGSQPCYRDSRMAAGGKHAVGGSRDREIGELMYSIRSFEKFVPWHTGQIYIVSPGHIPHWVDLTNPRLKVINQDDLFPDYAKSFLPTFNTHVIEQFLYLIPGLSDIFMQVNDDYIFTQTLAPHDIFTCSGGIKLLHEAGLISHAPPTPKKGIWISSVLNTQQEMDLRWGPQDRYFIKHAPFVYSRRAFERVHQIFDRPLYATLKSKFRGKPDMNMPLLHHYYMVSQGSKELGIPIEAPPEDEMTGYKLVLMQDDTIPQLQETFAAILGGSSPYKIVALNDEYSDMKVADVAVDFFARFLPAPSAFERKPGAPDPPLSIRKPETCEVDDSILSPFPRRIDTAQKYEVIAYRELRWVLFVNSLLRGVALGLGCMIVYVFYLLVLRRNTVPGSSSAAYDKV
ncbi:hypothetical protein PybrP1_001989 [[Pythium] brassicae (nom. inval.)]|nr:hypothetical protein PybrP1_001989 [[Pythium] brassicae (nom. inval.)]